MGSGILFFLSSQIGNVFPSKPAYLPKDYPDLKGKVALITGANAGIGYEAAKLLASKNCTVLFGVRNVAKGTAAVRAIQDELCGTGKGPIGGIDIVEIDLSDLTTIESAVEKIKSKTDKLNFIIHNAGVMDPPAGSKTKQNYELQLGTNVIGPFLLQKKLDSLFIGGHTELKRIIWLSSSAHLKSPARGGIQWDDINFAKTPQNTGVAYGQSKAANVYLSHMWSQKHSEEAERQNIVSIAVHPGLLNTALFQNPGPVQKIILHHVFHPPIYGAYTELFAALSPSLSWRDNGKYIVPWGKIGELRDDIEKGCTDGTAQKLWSWLEAETSSY